MMVDLQATYVRTAAGLAELKARALNLTREQRNLLIVLDGKSPVASLAKIVGCAPEALQGIADALARSGLIALPGAAPAAASAQQAASPDMLRALAERIFGSRAAPVLHKLEKAGESPADLLAAAESAAKLAKLTIDEAKAQAFLAEARKLIFG